MIRVEGVGKVFSDGNESKTVLKDITFHIKKGELVTLLGESGCGKSTLLEMIGGFMKPTSGEIYIGGMRVTRPIRTCVTLFQDGNLLPWLNVLDNVMLGLSGTKAEKREKAETVLSFVGLEGHLRRFPHELSGGMKQRAAIARAFAMEPDVILMDEPFAALDTFNRYHLQDELLRLQAQKETSILLVTHDIDEAIYLSDKIIILSANPGRIYDIVDIKLTKPRDRSSEYFHQYRK
ncbi:MAG: ABC transporter ATP-binding protein, partial [Bacilli bacterium]|nr:ABC transporter ATP-binding protein [Bacilli bacterium]